MAATEGDRPGGAPNSGTKPTDRPKSFDTLTAAEQLRVVEILRPGFERALARYRERKRLEADALARAA